MQGAIESPGADLYQPMGAKLRPLHLLLLGEALVDHDVDRGLHEGGRDRFVVALTLAVMRDERQVVPDVGGELGRSLGETGQIGVTEVIASVSR